jgi:hypothetical protein
MFCIDIFVVLLSRKKNPKHSVRNFNFKIPCLAAGSFRSDRNARLYLTPLLRRGVGERKIVLSLKDYYEILKAAFTLST